MELSKKGRKKWYPVVASEHFKNVVIGEVPLYSPDVLAGRTLWVNLAHLTGELKDHSIRMRFRIKNVTGERAETELIGYQLLSTYIKRLVRPGKSRVDDSFIVHTQDKVKLRVKMLYLTRKNVKKSITQEVMKKGQEQTADFFGKHVYEEAINEVIWNRFQRSLKSLLSKIYPLSSVDVKAVVKMS
ncbi:MAG TPA: hypothetical protein VJJ21_00860 [Candidatus Nanoarchaeia archaeon]|nr:hypothetical protein [Candidatus Nanoarchaeia archaeon]